MNAIYFQAESDALTIVGDPATLVRTRTVNQEGAPGAVGYDEFGLRQGYTGDGYLDINGTSTGVRATFELNVPAGTYNIHLRVANGAGGTSGDGFNRPIAIAVNGELQGGPQNTHTGGFDRWAVKTFPVTLVGEGPFTIGIVQATSGGAPNIDVIAVSGPGETPLALTTIQAEGPEVSVQDIGVPSNGDFTRVVDAGNPDATGNYRAGAVGGAYMDFGSNPGDAITFNVDAPTAGTYAVLIRYATASNRPLDLSVNGAAASQVAFVPGGAAATTWETWVEKAVQVDLVAGENTIKLAIPAGSTAGGPNIDQISLMYLGGDNAVNQAPVVVDGGIADATVAEDSAFNLDLSTRFSDADGESLTFSAAGLP
ncbi:carbohydrate-binding protein, partial [Microvirga sp. GCM10011540]|uniref:carbohydrate-binding protein n=1 Tax=Microvirga sp. GCM10011540 TaxID=3317338 RepID=UPI0036242BDB